MKMMNKKGLAAAVAATVLLGMGSSALAATATGDASGEVVKAMTIAKNIALDFGRFTASGTSGTVVLTPSDGTRSVTGGVTALTGSAGAVGTFDVTGANDATYAVTVPASATLSDGAATPNTMSFDPSYYSVGSALTDSTGTLSATGTDTLKVGGTLSVGVSQVVGVYRGTYDVTVEYN